MKNQMVIWSGGADSSLILWEKIRKNDNVCAVSFITEFLHKKKIIAEGKAREKFKKKAQEYNYKIDHRIINLDSKIGMAGSLPQQTTWTCLATLYAMDNTIVSFGYHRGDDFWHIDGWANQIRRNINSAMGKNVEFEFPLEWKRKYEIIDDIRYYGLEDCFWTCEGNTNVKKPCGGCRPCIALKLAEQEKSIITAITPKGEVLKK